MRNPHSRCGKLKAEGLGVPAFLWPHRVALRALPTPSTGSSASSLEDSQGQGWLLNSYLTNPRAAEKTVEIHSPRSRAEGA